jgi:hypothetical protein
VTWKPLSTALGSWLPNDHSYHVLRCTILLPGLQMSQDLSAQARDFDQDFIRVSCHALAISVRDEAIGWVRAISQTMREMDVALLNGLRDRIHKYTVALKRKPDTLDELKAVSVCVQCCGLVGMHMWGQMWKAHVGRQVRYLRCRAASSML